MITRAHILEVEGGFELHFTERYPYREITETSWVDFKTTREDARQVAQEAHSFHIINLVTDLLEELQKLNSPILQPLVDELNEVLNRCTPNYLPNHRQLCRDISELWHYMGAVTTDRARLIARELQDTVKYEMTTEQKKWVLE